VLLEQERPGPAPNQEARRACRRQGSRDERHPGRTPEQSSRSGADDNLEHPAAREGWLAILEILAVVTRDGGEGGDALTFSRQIGIDFHRRETSSIPMLLSEGKYCVGLALFSGTYGPSMMAYSERSTRKRPLV
jgi:hypothetical protein